MKSFKLMAALGGALIFTSCIDHKDNDLEYKMNYSNFFNYVEDLTTGSTYYYTGVGYSVTYNATKMLADLSISSLTLPAGIYTTLSFNQVPWTVDKVGWFGISLANATPLSSMIAPTFNSLTFNILDRYVLTNTYYPSTKVNYRIGDQYQVYSFPSAVVNVGTSSVSNVKEGTTYSPSESDEFTYVISLYNASTPTNLNEVANRKADFMIYNLRLKSTMTPINIEFDGVPFNCIPGGVISLTGNESYAVKKFESSSSQAYSDFVVTNLSCTTDASNNMTLVFTLSSASSGESYNITAYSTVPTE